MHATERSAHFLVMIMRYTQLLAFWRLDMIMGWQFSRRGNRHLVAAADCAIYWLSLHGGAVQYLYISDLWMHATQTIHRRMSLMNASTKLMNFSQ